MKKLRKDFTPNVCYYVVDGNDILAYDEYESTQKHKNCMVIIAPTNIPIHFREI